MRRYERLAGLQLRNCPQPFSTLAIIRACNYVDSEFNKALCTQPLLGNVER